MHAYFGSCTVALNTRAALIRLTANPPSTLPIAVPSIYHKVDIVKFRMARRKIKVIQLRLIEYLRPHLM